MPGNSAFGDALIPTRSCPERESRQQWIRRRSRQGVAGDGRLLKAGDEVPLPTLLVALGTDEADRDRTLGISLIPFGNDGFSTTDLTRFHVQLPFTLDDGNRTGAAPPIRGDSAPDYEQNVLERSTRTGCRRTRGVPDTKGECRPDVPLADQHGKSPDRVWFAPSIPGQPGIKYRTGPVDRYGSRSGNSLNMSCH